jgi:hypothetical protein
LTQVGFHVNVLNYKSTEKDVYYGHNSPETILIATK